MSCEGRFNLRPAGSAILTLAIAAGVGAQELHLFTAEPPDGRVVASPGPLDAEEPGIEQLERAEPWSPAGDPGARCVLFQCRKLPIEPAPRLFTTGVTLWTAAGLLGGGADGIHGPIAGGFHRFRFTDEGFFQYATYGGGSDKASHFVISASVADLLYDAYSLNGLTENQSFVLALGTTVIAGALVEVGDGLTLYGFSAQDLAADTLGALAGVLVKRRHLDDLIGFQLGKVPTTIPPAVIGARPLFGIDYSKETYSIDVKLGGLAPRLRSEPGLERYLLLSFLFMTKGYGYDPPIPSRYQQVGLEIGLNFPEILKAAGVDDSTWWGDTLLRMFRFIRVPYTQVGAYYNFKNRKWYGPGAPYRYY